MYSNSFEFNLDNFQPLFVDIKDCRMFKEQVVSMNPRYIVKKKIDGGYVVETDKEYLDLTKGLGIDLLAICGRNGLGKSTLLRILQNQNLGPDSDYTVFWKDADNNILSTDNAIVCLDGVEMSLDQDMFHIDSITMFCGNRASGAHDDAQNSFERNIVQVYQATPEIFDREGVALFDGYTLGFSPEFWDETETLTDDYNRRFRKQTSSHDLRNLFEKNPTIYVLANGLQSLVYNDPFESETKGVFNSSVEQLLLEFIDSESEEIDKAILSLMFEGEVQSGWTIRDQNDKNQRLLEFTQYSEIREVIVNLSASVDKWIKHKTSELGLEFRGGRLDDLLWEYPLKNRRSSERTGLGSLSAGEQQKLRATYYITPYLFQESISWFYFDDADARLHPEWSRRYVYDLIEAYCSTARKVADIKGKNEFPYRRLTCILVTHSPFFLTDLMPQNLLFLAAKQDGVDIRRGVDHTFAGNIGQLFHAEFFMDSTIGEFARSKIQSALKSLDSGESSEKKEEFRKLFLMVGDPVLRNLLLERL